MNELRTTLERWLSRHEVPPGHPLEQAHLEVLKAFYALLLVGGGGLAPTPEPVLERLLPGLPFRPEDRPSLTLANLGVCRLEGPAHDLQERLRASLSPEQAESYLSLVGP